MTNKTFEYLSQLLTTLAVQLSQHESYLKYENDPPAYSATHMREARQALSDCRNKILKLMQDSV